MRQGESTVDPCVDRDFVWELAKRGAVEIFTRQVSVRGTALDLKGVKIPKGCEIEFASAKPDKYDSNPPEVQITFGWPDGT